MRDDLPENKKSSVISHQSSDDDTPARVSFHSLKDDDSSDEEEASEIETEKPEPQKPSRDMKDEVDDEGDIEEKSEEVEESKKSILDTPEELEETNVAEPEQEQYYLQTVKVGEQPEWPRPKEDLSVFSQPLGGGLIQYWAYPKRLQKSANALPHAEKLANKNQSEGAVIIIDQICDHLTPGSCLELILAREGHALAKTDSNLENLEANISSLLDLGRQNFGITAEHFMSTSNVSPEVDERLSDLEEAEEKKIEEKKVADTASPYFTERNALNGGQKRSKLFVIIPILVLIVIFGTVVYYRGKLLAKFINKINPPPPPVVEVLPTPTPTPTISVERSEFKVRVLNGTPKTGAAKALADKLKEKGWQIERTGNATLSAIPESYVRAKEGLDNATAVLLLDVEDYQGTSSSSLLKPTDKADLEFVIGRK